ncbi:MAG: antibiotic biosynthesis monooxygenase [Bacteroidetes bacterium]|nr:antibiotic biosynthesis monooxygenase [Bacteroidota bacterium]
MINRIVKMTFKPEEINNFLSLFEQVKDLIKACDGCLHLELWLQIGNKNVLFTFSQWISEEHLNNYRHSLLFEDTWAKTKALFAAKPEAWSVEQLVSS